MLDYHYYYCLENEIMSYLCSETNAQNMSLL